MFKKNKIVAPFVMKNKAPEAQVASAGIPAEVVAAIAGAVAVICGGAVIKSIRRSSAVRKASRGAWGNASVSDNTRAF